ncbi:hypothetical protein ECC02_002262 [Trypanosoma cruzi]|uniref:BRCT domain-containing protein n=1 Tax=Trypanosoma cruzi TaxID=5693 RepID=A0A7J6YDQ8_TRYCR|nr:hypothetical protein ECC02_002262 [Trypanosoma cruzi]
MTPSLLPFTNVKVLLHVREIVFGDGGDRTKHYAKKALRKLGASLTLSECTADLIVFHCGSESLLENATAHGKTIVTPAYLQECVKRMERLPVEGFLVRPRMAPAQRKEAKRTGCIGGGPQEERPTVMTSTGLSTIPYLDDVAEAEVEKDGASHVKGSERQDGATARPTAVSSVIDCDDDADGMGVLVRENSFSSAGRRREMPLQPDDCNSSGSPLVHVGASTTPFKEAVKSTHRGIMQSTSSKEVNLGVDSTKDPSALPCMGARRKALGGTMPAGRAAVSSSSSSSLPTATVKRRATNSTDEIPAVQRKRDWCFTDSASDEHLTGASSKKRNKTQERKTVSGTHEEGATQLTMAFTDTCLITPLFASEPAAKSSTRHGVTHLRPSTSPPQLRVAVTGDDDDGIQFLCDIVEQLGGVCVPRLFGRVRKPTHLVLEGRGELTPMVLLAKALGIPVLTPQWLYDAIGLGAFPKIIRAHLHPIYSTHVTNSDDDTCSGGGSGKEENDEKGGRSGATPMHSLRRDAGVEKGLVGLFEHDVGPYYKPIFLGMVVALVSHSPLAHADQFMELVRILGGFVSRSALSLNLSVIVDLRCGAAASDDQALKEEQEDVGIAADVKRRNPRRGALRRAKAGSASETQSSPMKYRTALSDGRNASRHDSHDVLQRLLAQRRQHDLPAVPVVSVEWIIQCILLGEVTETAPFEVAVSGRERVGGVEMDHSIEKKQTEENYVIAMTPPRQTMWIESDKRSETGRRHITIPRQPHVVTSPFAKTSEGPSSAMKCAEQQLSTQQLLLSLDSEDE